MRFDDSLQTVLSAETETEQGARSAWRQLVDLIGRGRAAATADALARLRSLREQVPVDVRAASARALAFATPPAALVALFGEDRLEIAAPVLRTAVLSDAEWAAILPTLSPGGRSVLRHRRDLPPVTVRALEAFGPTDFVLGDARPQDGADTEPSESAVMPGPVRAPVEPAPTAAEPEPAGVPRFEIADLVARIDAFNRTRERPAVPRQAVDTSDVPADSFRFETDATATVTWVDGVARGALVGLSLAHAAVQGEAQVDGGVAGACRRRAPFRDARLLIGGRSDAAGSWRVSGIPAFDPASGRFLGYRGTARRPRADESAAPPGREGADSLRQLVHELRTPTNAIVGFAELIESELLGPVADPYRAHATAIRGEAGALVRAIEDLDTAARIDGGALELRATEVSLHAVAAAAVADLLPLAALRGAEIVLLPDEGASSVLADDRAVERLVSRLLSALVSAASRGERLTVAIGDAHDGVMLAVDRPAALDTADDAADAGAPLLGTAFALRLATNLAAELGGSLRIDGARLTLRLPAAVDRGMEQAQNR